MKILNFTSGIDWENRDKNWHALSTEEREEISSFLLELSEKERKDLFRSNPHARRIYVEKLKHFDDEDDLLLLLLASETGELYPKVTTIARTGLAPDIDLLRIVRPYQKAPSLVGYECKLLNRKRNVLGPIYAGLGQALCYFRYGVDQAWLVIGVPSEVSNDIVSKLREALKFLWESRTIPRYLGVKWIREGNAYFTEDIKPENRFYVSSYESANYMRESLLRGEFAWSKKMKGDESG
jgi:hypothetical protein